MIVIAALLIGAVAGWRRARRLGGDRRDLLQYSVAYAILLAVPGLLLTVVIDRMT